MNTIEIKDLSHQFKQNEIVLDNLSLHVPKGSIYGFLGPNGAGKTTTLRLILGLLQQQSGNIKIFGKSFTANRIEILKKVGSLIEYPSIYGQLTAHQNLLVWQKIYQCPMPRIQEVLSLVGLRDVKDKKASNFSLGMKQRLGLAIALLNQPELLILDEPSNGLDPNGIIEMRELLIQLNKEFGITILLSSHLLAEIEKLVSHVGLIHQGKIVYEGELDSFLKNKQSTIRLQSNNNQKALELLASKFQAILQEDSLEISVHSEKDSAEIVRLLVQNNIEVYELSKCQSSLENVFMNFIK
ncbi:MAG: ABC transporter ATP-binding protein [Chitinophagales bacterium]|nr:ABC transporter ATP-binding protein [Bacteroidota bacterium]MCB9257311.1 ABC transporter ATP-binding protein [Chitinophagales bacterium]